MTRSADIATDLVSPSLLLLLLGRAAKEKVAGLDSPGNVCEESLRHICSKIHRESPTNPSTKRQKTFEGPFWSRYIQRESYTESSTKRRGIF